MHRPRSSLKTFDSNVVNGGRQRIRETPIGSHMEQGDSCGQDYRRAWRNAGSSSGGGPRERGQAQALLIRPRAGVSLVCNGKDASGNSELITVLKPEIDKITAGRTI